MPRIPKVRMARGVPRPLSRHETLRVIEALGAVTHLVSSLEYLIDERDRLPGGLMDRGILRPAERISTPVLRQLVALAARPAVTRALHVARVAAAAALLAPLPRRARLAADAFLTGSQLVLYPGNSLGNDGSDQAAFLVQSVTTIARAWHSRPRLVDACLWYVAAQSAVNYGVSGWAKLAGPDWRSGAALPGIMRTKTYGHEGMWKLITRYPTTGRLLGASVLAMECSFPAVLVGPARRLAPFFVASAAAFHVVNDHVMGLNRFLPAFVAMHPAVLYVTGPRERVDRAGQPERRSDSMPVAMVLAGIGAALAAGVANHRRRRLVRRGRGDERAMAMSSGNILRWRRTGPDPTSAPVVVCESGLASTGDHWEWISRELSPRYPVVTYHRAGYGGSSYAGRGGYALDAAVDDLVELATRQAAGAPLVLLGHSLGGYLAWRAAARLTGQVRAIVVIDSSHPEELARAGTDDAHIARDVDRAVRIRHRLLRMGFGALAETPGWVRTTHPDVRKLLDAQHRDPATWTAARREWYAATRVPAGKRLAPITVPALIVTTAKTAENAAQVALHRAMAAAAPHAQHHIIPNSQHERVLTASRPAHRIAVLVDDFIQCLANPAGSLRR
jgi:pimeloyl-ACP methyl ester carboxylesterase